MAGCKQSKRLLPFFEDNFLVQVLNRPTRGKMLLDLVFINAEIIGGSLDCGYHALIKFTISRNVDLTKLRVRTPSFRRANFKLFKELLGEAPRKIVLRNKGTEQ